MKKHHKYLARQRLHVPVNCTLQESHHTAGSVRESTELDKELAEIEKGFQHDCSPKQWSNAGIEQDKDVYRLPFTKEFI